ncbi:MAG TPA: ATP-binding protein [Cyclobacteriaceae bacterium]|nr:ATP-binding protein [Cyclobacteriaceae bacterium]
MIEETSVLELLVNSSKIISSEVELEKLVQKITDIGTKLTNAAFGAFFYNVENESGEKYVLYTISGVPKEAFSKFPMPRNTAIFNPTFQGQGIVRYDDVTKQPHFGQSAPYHGMPKGHLPVRSYLAVPVISSFTGEVIGGLFFGHPEAGKFTEDSEKLIEGIAGQAAISMTNARLFEERKAVEKKLREQNAVFNTVTTNTMHALFMLNERQECTYMNPAAVAMTGYKLDELSGKPFHHFIQHTRHDGRHFTIEESPIHKAYASRTQVHGEDHFIHKAGHFYSVSFTASPIIESGAVKGIVVEARDTTAEKKLAENLRIKDEIAKELLEQKVKERTAELEKINYELLQFTSVASHDLKEPLRKISVFSKLLREKGSDQLDETMLKYTDNIIQSSARMATLIDDLLIFSRLSQTEIPAERVDLNYLLTQIVSDLEITIKEKNAKIFFAKLPTVYGVALQLGQVFQNLISNSLKFSRDGVDPVIHMTCDRIEKGGRSFNRINYTDNGIGFNNAHAEKIFEIFQRLHSKDKYEGTGVGLSIVKKIITMHNGEIRASSNGEGATFEILLPVV